MSSLPTLSIEPPTSTTRYRDVHHVKASGATYTPENLAAFVAAQVVAVANLPAEGRIRILDPAVGDGALLDALITAIPAAERWRVEAFGYDTDRSALVIASERLRRDFPDVSLNLEHRDFLSQLVSSPVKDDMFASDEQKSLFDLVIANPPYVRTQILGSGQAQELAKRFELTGRVDLYYAFLIGISQVLAPNGVTGIITSNRFMTTKSGQVVRRQMLSRFKMLHAWDLGDTKLFEAAVLPSVILARGLAEPQSPHTGGIKFSSIYETTDSASNEAGDALSALSYSDDSVVAIPDGRRFRVRHGSLENGGDAEGTWRVATEVADQWLATVASHTWDNFRRIGKIRVGVKSTADKVFVRSDWNTLPGGPPELVRPLITRHCARRFKAIVPENPKQVKEILYPHEVVDGARAAVDLNNYPISARYLDTHREALEGRSYLIEAGRRWYELWVPQDPGAWAHPKLVFPDISSRPIFWIDLDGRIVNGECYWLRCDNESEEELLWLALAVANSSFIEVFYDHRFNNKLYAGRRRFITQYVEQFPLPDPDREESRAIISLTKRIYGSTPSAESESLAANLDKMVWQVFGLKLEEITG